MPASTPLSRGRRVAFVDTLRGVAVLLMLAWHTLEGWLEPALGAGSAWRALRAAGGMGAPLFVLLAGVAVALKLAADARRRTSGRGPDVHPGAVWGLVGRGILIVFLGYTLRVQMWLLDSVAILRPESVLVWGPAAVGLVGVVAGCRRLEAEGPLAAARILLPAAAVFFGGLVLTAVVAPSRLEGVLRVDVLQCIGGSVVLVATLGPALGAVRRPAFAVAAGVAVMIATPLAARLLPASLAPWWSGWIADTPSHPAAFPLFPWCAYAWVGLALGTWLDRAVQSGPRVLVRTVTILSVAGVGVALLTSESLPHAYRWTHDAPWLVQPFRVSYRIGVAAALFAPALAVAERLPVLRTFGKASLVVYWVHLTFAFGLASRPIHQQLGWLGWLAGLLVLVVAMYAVARFRLGAFETWRSRAIATGPLSGKRALL